MSLCSARLALLLGLFASANAYAALDAPVTPNARPEVAELMRVLDAVSGKYILSGQQEIGWAPDRVDEDIAFIEKTTGKLPVVRGLDFGEYTWDKTHDKLRATERGIAWAKRGGIVAFCCHLGIHAHSKTGRGAFYQKESHFDYRVALESGTPENAELLQKLDIVAGELKKLQAAGVVVIWRPFHECSGNWFWWGTRGPEPYKKLWRLTFDRFTKVHHLDNLIWCYTPTDARGAIEAWYPGDDVVDMAGLDIYDGIELGGTRLASHDPHLNGYRALRAVTHGRKVIAMTENGPIPDPDRALAIGANWSYFVTWNQFEQDKAQNPLDLVKSVYASPKVITLDEYPQVLRELATSEKR